MKPGNPASTPSSNAGRPAAFFPSQLPWWFLRIPQIPGPLLLQSGIEWRQFAPVVRVRIRGEASFAGCWPNRGVGQEGSTEPVFTLQWPEFVIAQRLQSLLPRKDGYSVLVPLSRQEKGIDLAVLYRTGTGTSVTTAIQIKASRTYLHAPPKRKDTVRFRFNDLMKK